MFAAEDEAAAVGLVNDLVADARTTPRLTDHDGWPLHMHYYAPGARLAEHLAADCGMALAFVIAAGERVPAGDLRRPGLRPRARGPVPQPLQALLRQPHLRQPPARRRLPRPPADRLTRPPANRRRQAGGCQAGAWVPSSIGTRMPTSRAVRSAIS